MRLFLQVAQGLIWVWGENGLDSGLESAVTPAPLVPELDDTTGIDSGRVTTGSIYQRDLPYSWETFMENVLVSSRWAVLLPMLSVSAGSLFTVIRCLIFNLRPEGRTGHA